MIYNAYADMNENLMGVSIKSCGHIFAKQGREINRPKGRNDWLLFYVAKESENFYLDAEAVAEEGSFIFFRPHEKQHHIYKGDKTAEFYYIHFVAPDDFDLGCFETSKIYSSKPSTKVRDLFEEAIEEVQMKLPCYEKICVSKLFNIISLLERNVADINNPHRVYMDKIAFVVQIMNREYAKNYTLGEYADMCSMSKFHFIRMFENFTGTSPLDYRNKIRLEHAKEMLLDTCMPVSEIGMRLGFSSPSYFCDAFKKKTGMSPAAYRKTKI